METYDLSDGYEFEAETEEELYEQMSDYAEYELQRIGEILYALRTKEEYEAAELILNRLEWLAKPPKQKLNRVLKRLAKEMEDESTTSDTGSGD